MRGVRASDRETWDWASLLQRQPFPLCQWYASPAAAAAGQRNRYCYQTNKPERTGYDGAEFTCGKAQVQQLRVTWNEGRASSKVWRGSHCWSWGRQVSGTPVALSSGSEDMCYHALQEAPRQERVPRLWLSSAPSEVCKNMNGKHKYYFKTTAQLNCFRGLGFLCTTAMQ